MQTPFLVAANWKMMGSQVDLDAWLTGFSQSKSVVSDEFFKVQASIALCLPFPYLNIQNQLSSLGIRGLDIGAQDVSIQPENGAYTGEVSAAMLADIGCRWVVVGHSERRQMFGDTDSVCVSKFKHVQAAGLQPIFCVGETLEERDGGKAWAVVEAQLKAILQQIKPSDYFAIAYEPVWAIGTGQTASPEQAQEMHAQIRQLLEGAQLGRSEFRTPVLYGGSVKPENAAAIFAQTDIDGGLIGGASLQISSFLDIVGALRKVKLN